MRNATRDRDARVADIEEITHKTGHFRGFDTFVLMLRSALGNGSDCSLDILTYTDLQMLKSRHKSTEARAATPNAARNKRYIILTQAGSERCVLACSL